MVANLAIVVFSTLWVNWSSFRGYFMRIKYLISLILHEKNCMYRSDHDRSGQTVQTQIRLLLEEQFYQGLHCLLFHLHLFD